MSGAAPAWVQRHTLMLLPVLVLPRLAIALPAQAGTGAPAALQGLQACASIAGDTQRLACYDRLAAACAQAPACPAAAPPSAASAPVVTAPLTETPPPPAAGAAAPAPPQPSFGLYAAEHPKPSAPAQSLQAEILAVGRSPRGRMTVSLTGGAVWELSESDPLLAVGDVVTITRAALGSYILETPTHRSHRAYRLQ